MHTTTRVDLSFHLFEGRWFASCPTCGYELVSARTQQRCERRAQSSRCPICGR